jgi:hypothetical protein
VAQAPAGLRPCTTCTVATPLPSTSPRCDEYGEERYRGASLKCFCKCAGDDGWSQQVRGCLACEHSQGTESEPAHRSCYLAAGPGAPRRTLLMCYVKCYGGH